MDPKKFEKVQNTAELYPKSFEHHLCLANYLPYATDAQVQELWIKMLADVGPVVQAEEKEIQEVRTKCRKLVNNVRAQFISQIAARIVAIDAENAAKPVEKTEG